MAVKRSVPDETKEHRLRAIARNLESIFAAHQKVCYDCRPGDNLPGRACDEGWRMLKESSRALHVLAMFIGDRAATANDVQVTLWQA